MLVIIPLCNKDAELAIANLQWQEELQCGALMAHDCLIHHEESTRPDHVDQASAIARRVYRNVEVYRYPDAPVKSWPQGPNWAFQNAARYVPTRYQTHWLWLEADAIPLKPGWVDAIDAEYLKAGKPLMGHVVNGVVPMGHVNGVAVYPCDVSTISTRALLCEKQAWDTQMAADTWELRHDAWKLIGHCWGIYEGKADHTRGEAPVFRELQNVYDWVNLDCAIFHRCKDDSLIKWLRHMRSADFNVPKLCPKVEVVPDSGEFKPTEIFLVTYHKDIPWLDYCLRSVVKFCHGFTGITLVVPSAERHLFKKFVSEIKTLRLASFDETPGKGMTQHMGIECMADQFVPHGVECVLHLDADTIFNGPTTPAQFFRNGKPIYVWRTYDSLYDPVRKVNSDCVIWKEPTEKALGFQTNIYGMCVMPCINDLRLFPEFRQWIMATHKKPFWEWVTAGRNEFPQSWSEYAALGAFAKELMPELYHWLNCAHEAVPKENSYHFHSHSGLTPQIREQMEGWLK